MATLQPTKLIQTNIGELEFEVFGDLCTTQSQAKRLSLSAKLAGRRIRIQRFKDLFVVYASVKTEECKIPSNVDRLTGMMKDCVRAHYGFACTSCGMTAREHYDKWRRKLELHHIDGDSSNNNVDNLATLCRSCHGKVHSKK